jgi:hypothetical protein
MPTVAIDTRGGGPGAAPLLEELRRFHGLRVPRWRPWSWLTAPDAVHALGGRLPRLPGRPGVITLTPATDAASLAAAALVLCPSQVAMTWAAGRPGARPERLRVVTLAPAPVPRPHGARPAAPYALALVDAGTDPAALRRAWARAAPGVELVMLDAEPGAGLLQRAQALVDLRRGVLFGGVALAALEQGVPVVAAPGGAVAEAVGEAAVLADPADPGALGAALERVLADRQALALAGRERAALFTWSGTAEATVMAYRELWSGGLR